MRAIALFSGGLDSAVSMLLARQDADIELALTIDYGQKARFEEIRASAAICAIYGIPQKVIRLAFMSEMNSGIIESSDIEDSSPWVPNRNGLFLNLAACYAENCGAELIVCGFNREEGIDFPDNSRDYVEAVNIALSYSTLNHVQVRSFVQDMDKVEIAIAAMKLGLDTNLLWSCYRPGVRPCGQCPSCLRNIAAFKKAGIVNA